MCGGMGGQQAQASGGAGMMCGRPAQAAQEADPFDSKVQPQQKQAMGCPCCRGMAMMQGGGTNAEPHSGMDMKPK